MRHMKQVVVCLLLLLGTNCGRKVSTSVAVPPPPLLTGPWDYEVAYQEGLKAFRLATPEGYRRAAVSFQKASELETTNCEYPLRRAESLYFLAQQQKLNWEDFSGSVSEAIRITQFNEGT